MKRLVNTLAALGVLGACALGATARADNLLGLYVGAGVGESDVRSDHGYNPYDGDDSAHHTAFKGIVGIRPIPFVGAEAEYIDFGHPSSGDAYSDYGSNFSRDSHPKAGVLYGVGYLPLPFLDVFAKVGVARLETRVNEYTGDECSGAGANASCAPLYSRTNQWETKTAYGAGVQGKFFNLGVRAEYERISSTFGDPDAFTVSATWTF